MESRWLGLIELFVVFGFVLAFGAVELYALRLDRRRAAQRKAEEAAEVERASAPPSGAGAESSPSGNG
jgi:hypothetical protein